MRRRTLLGLGLLLGLAGTPAAAAGPSAARPNVVLFYIDTFRADHAHCYGYRRETTPSLDSLAARGTLFETHIAASSWSLPCYGSIFTSLPPPTHGASDLHAVIDRSFTTLAGVMAANGYATAAFVGGAQLTHIFGMDNGFQTYEDEPNFASLFDKVPAALAWLDRHGREKPFLLMVQGYDAHQPYDVPLGFADVYDQGYQGLVHDQSLLCYENIPKIAGNVFRSSGTTPNSPTGVTLPAAARSAPRSAWVSAPLSAADRAHMACHYDGALTYADTWLGYFLEEFEARGFAKNTIVLFGGDHGEGLGEHGYYHHRFDLYDSMIHVPLVIAGPGVAAGRRVKDLVEQVDLAPTILELCSLAPCRAFQGRSLAPYLSSTPPVPAEGPERIGFSSLTTSVSARTSRWHYIRETPGKRFLYDLVSDPDEQTNLLETQPKVVDWLDGQLTDWLERTYRKPTNAAEQGDASFREILRQGGYW